MKMWLMEGEICALAIIKVPWRRYVLRKSATGTSRATRRSVADERRRRASGAASDISVLVRSRQEAAQVRDA